MWVKKEGHFLWLYMHHGFFRNGIAPISHIRRKEKRRREEDWILLTVIMIWFVMHVQECVQGLRNENKRKKSISLLPYESNLDL